MKNFSNTLVVLVTTIPTLEAPPGMIDYTFLLAGKNDLCKPNFPFPRHLLQKPWPDHLCPDTLVPLAPRIFLIDNLELRTLSTSTRSLVIRYIMR